MKKLCLLMAIMLVFTTFCSCSKSGKNASKLEGNTYAEGFPIVKEKEKLNVMTLSTLNHGDFNEMGFTEYYEEKTNIDIDWTTCSYEELDSKLTLMFQSDDLPDVIALPSNYFGYERLVKGYESGQIIQLDELIEKYGTNIKKAFEKTPDAKIAATAADGHIYSLPTVTVQEKNHEKFPQKLYIRKTWLDNLGLAVPKTTDELYNVLKAFKENDPNGNGEADEIPFATNGIDPSFYGSFGISFNWNNNSLCVNDDGKVQYAFATDNAKKALSYFNRLYSMEYLELYDSESKWRTKLKNGLVGAFYSLASYTFVGSDLAEEYEMIAPPQGIPDVSPVMSVSGSITPNAFIITKACKNPEAALRWADYFYSNDGYYLLTYGKPGDMIKQDSDGLWEFTDYDTSKDRFTFTPGYVLPYYRDTDTDKLFKEKSEKDMSETEILNQKLNEETSKVYEGKYEPKNFIWQPALDKEAIDVINTCYPSIREYSAEMVGQFAIGAKNINTEWDTYIAELNKKGLADMIKQYQRVYDAQNK